MDTMDTVSRDNDLKMATACIKRALIYQRHVTIALRRGLTGPTEMARHLTNLTVAASLLHRAYHLHWRVASEMDRNLLNKLGAVEGELTNLVEDFETRQLVKSIGASLNEVANALRERLGILRDYYGEQVGPIEALLSPIPVQRLV